MAAHTGLASAEKEVQDASCRESEGAPQTLFLVSPNLGGYKNNAEGLRLSERPS